MENIKEIKKQISELQSKIDKLENENKNNNRNRRWRAKKGEGYYCVDSDGEVINFWDDRDSVDDYRYRTRNYFKTIREAQEYAEVIDTYYDLMDLADELNNGEKIDWNNLNQSKYYIYFDYDGEELTQDISWCYKEFGQIYCLDINFKRKAIERIGKDRLIKLFKYERS